MSQDVRLDNFAKQLRGNQTKAETLLWQYLRAGRLAEYKFRRQYAIGTYIVDFYCVKAKIAVEIDGDDHYTEEHQIYDAKRSAELSSNKIEVLRYTNREVIYETDRVLEDILRHVNPRIQEKAI